MRFAPAALAVAGLLAAGTMMSVDGAPRAAWTAVDSLPSPAGPGSAEPSLATSPDGRVFMTWLEPANPGHTLWVSELVGNQWSARQAIRTGTDFFVNWADFPSVVALDSGRLVVHWLQRSGTGTYAYGIRLSQSRDGGKTWSTPITPHRDSSQTEHGFVTMWPERGGVGAAWLDGRKFNKEGHSPSNEMMLMSTTLSRTGTLGAEVRLDERTCDCCQNSAAMTSDGPIVAYRNRSTEEIRDIYVTRRVGNRWTPGVAVHNDNWKINACPVNGPAVAAAGKRVALAWFTAANEAAKVQVAFSDDAGAKFSAPIRIDGGTPAGRVDVALLKDGNTLVTWIERTGGDTAVVRARRIDQSRRVGPPITVASSSAARSSGFPRLATTASHVVFAWTVPGRPSMVRVARAAMSELR